MITILIDNGHGSDTKGKHSPDKKLLEYAWAREIATMLAERLRAEGMIAERIVKETYDVKLAERTRRVNEICRAKGSQNCVLVSVHINAAGGDGKWHDARGFSVFVSKNASTKSKKLAAIFTDEAKRMNLLGNRSVPATKYWTWSWTTADIAILKNTNCPAVLTENLFMDNRADMEYLLSERGKKEIVELHVKALREYVKQVGQ